MNILTTIAELLTEHDKSLATTFSKIKVLGVRLDNKELVEWINLELMGYSNNDILPDYRIHRCNIFGCIHNGYNIINNTLIAIDGLKPHVKRKFSHFTLCSGISALESMINDKNLDRIAVPVSPENLNYLTDNYQDNGNLLCTVVKAQLELSKGAIEQSLSAIRGKALDLILGLETKFGYEIDLEILLKQKKLANSTITNILHQTISATGSNNIINLGNDSQINNK